MHWKSRSIWIPVGILILLIAGISFSLDPILRRTIERGMNRHLKGYRAHVASVAFHPIGFSIDLHDTTIVQTAHPDPPVMSVSLLHASVQWKALLHLRLVADFLFVQPKIYANLAQARSELKSSTPLNEQGWQEALESIYPLKINEFRLQDASVTYVDEGPYRPLRLTHLDLQAENIRNIALPNDIYPSTVQIESTVFDTGKMTLTGRANFLAVPHVTMKGDVALQRVILDYLKPLTRKYHLDVRGGTFSTAGAFEYATNGTAVNVKEVAIDDVEIEYVRSKAIATEEAQTAKAVARSAKEAGSAPHLTLSMDILNIRRSRFGFRDESTAPPYGLFLSDANLRLEHVSNQGALGRASGSLSGKFMGSGATQISLNLAPNGTHLDMDLAVKIEGTDLRTLNDFLRANAGFDVGGGQFALYSQDTIRQGYLTGYIKPLFTNLQIPNPRTHPHKPLGQRIKERMIQALASILQNPARHEVGTVVNLSGPLISPKYSSWQALGGILRNAFFQPLLHRLGTG
jgi:hypothetical protein